MNLCFGLCRCTIQFHVLLQKSIFCTPCRSPKKLYFYNNIVSQYSHFRCANYPLACVINIQKYKEKSELSVYFFVVSERKLYFDGFFRFRRHFASLFHCSAKNPKLVARIVRPMGHIFSFMLSNFIFLFSLDANTPVYLCARRAQIYLLPIALLCRTTF